MRILHIITRLIVGGAQENTLLTCEGLHRRGHEVTLLTGPSPGPEGSLMRRAEMGGYRVMVTPELVRNPNILRDWKAYREIGKLCREMGPDVVHTHSSKAGVLGRAAGWKWKREMRDAKRETRGPAIVHTIHGLPFHPYQSFLARRMWIGMERFAARRCDHIITVADAMTRQALAAGVGAERGRDLFTTIYSAMETEAFLNPGVTRAEVREKLRIPPTAYVFGTIARLQPLKGHSDLLKYAGELFAKVPDAHLLWIGDGVFREQFEAILRAQGWMGRVTLTGLVAPEEVPRLLPAMDVLVHPSYREGLARALPQALLAGVPVISYDCDGAAEVCIDPATGSPTVPPTGFLVKTGDAAGLCAAMVRIAHDRAAGAVMGQNGRVVCAQRFAADHMVKEIEAVYRRLLQSA
jgi:glycosyltransferase involved in cell wall biosynthesis